MSYKVKKGDNLSKIAKQHGLTLDELMKLNNISKENANKIAIGQELKIQSSNADFKNPLKLDYLQPTKQELPIPYKSTYTKKQQIKDNAQSIQQQLKDAGYNLGTTGKNKDGVDGSWGNKSQAALDQALKDGYIYDEKTANIYKKEKPKLKEKSSTASYQYSMNPMFGTPITPTKSTTSNKQNDDPGLIADTFNWLGRQFPTYSVIGGFTKHPYKGSEEEARKLGYKHYTEDGFTRHTVDYSVPNQENMTDQQRSQAQIDKYGITQEQVRDKSPVSSFVYNYAPGYGYNVLRFIENVARNNKVRQDGQPAKKTIKTPVADAITEGTADVLDFIGANKLAGDLRESNTYPINESKQRNDLSNYYFGYPMNGRSIKVSQHTETGKGNRPDNKYFMEFVNDSHIYRDPAYAEAVPGGGGVEATGENMGTWSASKDKQGRKAYYDKWDINPLTHIPGLESLPNLDFIGTGFELYGKQKR